MARPPLRRRATYENIGSVVVPGDESSDPSHYCNPQQVGIDIEKATNGADADDPDATDVPLIQAGAPVAWTYVIRNDGNVTLRADQVQVTDSDSSVNPVFDPGSDNGDGLLSPGESWTYTAGGNALDLPDSADDRRTYDCSRMRPTWNLAHWLACHLRERGPGSDSRR